MTSALHTRIGQETDVDDVLNASSSLKILQEVKRKLSVRFEMTRSGKVRQFLGMIVERDLEEGVLRINQRDYMEELLRLFNVSESKVRKRGGCRSRIGWSLAKHTRSRGQISRTVISLAVLCTRRWLQGRTWRQPYIFFNNFKRALFGYLSRRLDEKTDVQYEQAISVIEDN